MDWNSAVSRKLLAFHSTIAEEYRSTLAVFNLYVYGYGEKQKILREVFPHAHEVDFGQIETALMARAVYEYYGMTPKMLDIKYVLADINKNIAQKETDKVLVLYNAKKEVIEGIENMHIVLVEHRDLCMSHSELVQGNYIMRDISTFVQEVKTKADKQTKTEEIMNIYDCVGSLSKRVLKTVLRYTANRAEFALRDMYNREKRKLLIVSYATFREALAPFIDAKIVTENEGRCKANLTKKELTETITALEGMEADE